MKVIFFIFSLALLFCNIVIAQRLEGDGKTFHFEADFPDSLNSDGWQADMGCGYCL